LRTRETIEKAEDAGLAPWAQRAARSRGRRYPDPPHPYRTEFQRDRDRVTHSRAFRRLQYKTQVLPYHEGDHFRNRLTHTLEGAQIARTAARALGANEDLTEAIALAHDLGHPPFGHAGEKVLHALMAEHGGFEHNRQSLRTVDHLELRSPRYRGLNLTDETRAGILKHGASHPRYGHPVPLPELGRSPSAEAQIANLCDAIAYHSHDIDDGLRAGILAWDDLGDVALLRRVFDELHGETGRGDPDSRPRLSIALIDLLASDLVAASWERLTASGVASPEAVLAFDGLLIGFSDPIEFQRRELGAFLHERFYRHHLVVRMADKAERILRDLWRAYVADPRQLPPQALYAAEAEPAARAIADYVAGMTDRFAMDEHRKLFDPHAHV
jgi:dGTPase